MHSTTTIIPKMPRKKQNSIDQQIFERQAVICKAFAHPKRLHILSILGRGECSFSDIQSELALSKANASQHISILRSAGVIGTRRNGQHLYCYLAFPEVKQACHLIHEVLRTQIKKQRDFVL
jgi:DNA-binding transcriptional ArsR family regulator